MNEPVHIASDVDDPQPAPAPTVSDATGVVDPASLLVGDRPDGVWWAWMPLHGGTGATTLASLLPGGRELLLPVDHGLTLPVPAVPIVRSHAFGLRAALDLAAAQAQTPTMWLAGLVIVADQPGRLPKPLADLAKLTAGGYPRTWWLPHVEPWRRGDEPSMATAPSAYRKLLADLVQLSQHPQENPHD